MCSTAFTTLARGQARALGYAQLPIAVIPHPFGIRTRDEVRQLAEQCVDGLVKQVCTATSRDPSQTVRQSLAAARVETLEVPDDLDKFNRFFQEQRWSDGLPLIPPTRERVERVLRGSRREASDVVAFIAPAFGEASVELIAVNAVLAGCYPEYLPVLIAAVEAAVTPRFNLQGIQTTTNPAAVWLVINGPIAQRLGVNSGGNCLGPGTWANATLGRALRLILHNIGGALPGEMDHSTHGQPGKYTFCCAENEQASPWEPLHVERGFAPGSSTVTVIGASGTWNMNTHAKDSGDLLRVIADTMAFPPSSDYTHAGEPWLMLSPEHAHILKRDGLSKADVKRRLWEQSKLAAHRMAAKDFARMQTARRAELGEIGPDTVLPISVRPEDISIIVAGGPGTHSVYVPLFGNTRSVTREVMDCS